MSCGSCTGVGGSKTITETVVTLTANARSLNEGGTLSMNGRDLVLVELTDNNLAKHPINYQGTKYGQRKHGDQFYILSEHVPYLPVKVVVIEAVAPQAAETEGVELFVENLPATPLMSDAPLPEVQEKDELAEIYDWTPEQREYLGMHDVLTAAHLLRLGVEGLVVMKGIGKVRANEIIAKATALVQKD